MGRRAALVFGHCMMGHCHNCPGVLRNGARAANEFTYCACKKCHPPVKTRKAEHAEKPPVAESPVFVKADRLPKEVKGHEVRAWARARGMEVPSRGRMPKHVLNLYLRDKARREGAAA